MLERQGERLIVRAAVTLETVTELLPEALAACRDGASLIDLSAVEQADSACLAFALELLREARREGRPLRFCKLPAAVRELAELYSLTSTLNADG